MWALWVIAAITLTMGSVGEGRGDDVTGTKPLLTIARKDLHTVLPPNCLILIDPHSIEQFLDALDGTPPDWGLVYGHGHHDPDHDDRLFALNRARDAKREGKPALLQCVTFVWSGELSRYDAQADGFHVALGPRVIVTKWGLVRFKYEELPSNLVAVPIGSLRKVLRRKLEKKQKIEIDVAITGRLIPTESLVYDFSHDQEGVGMIMPVVKVERLEYLLTNE